MSTLQSHPADSYTIGWICALSTEYVAACEFLDEEHEQLRNVPPNDNNSYTLGQIGDHLVVVGVLPDGEYGTSSAAAVARDMLRTFHNLRFGLMVGIGGGAPSSAHDIRLGDVVVSSPTAGKSGVVQYDYGKAIQDQEFAQTGVLDQPPTVLRTAVSSLKAHHERKGHKLREAAEAIVKGNQRLRKKYDQPNAASDRLYKTHVLHPPHDDRDCTKVCGSSKEDVEDRDPRAEEDDDPVIHYGLIASGNSLMKDARLRDKFAQEQKVLCFEMEAAGLMNQFRCLIIRGICDYSDTHKNKQWQGYAAMTAAAYAKELLLRIAPEAVSSTEKLAEIISTLQTGVDNIKSDVQDVKHSQYQQMQHYMSEQHRACHQTFKTSTYEAFKNRNPDRVPGTCSWVLQHSRYNTWRDSEQSDLLWISADPGYGKSVLAKSFIDDPEFLSPTNPSVCYFFFKDNEEQNSLATALCALVHQLFSQQPLLISHALEEWKSDGEKLQKETDKLWRILIGAATSPDASPVICVLDALDECRERDRYLLVDLFSRFRKTTTKRSLKFVITSRPYEDIERGLDQIPEIRLRGEEESETLEKEINLVIRQRIGELAKEVPLRDGTRRRLENKLLDMQHRTYLWLYLVIDSIRETYSSSLREDEELFDTVPPSVEAAYEQILSKIPEKQTHKVRQVLTIIIGARRPLSIGELQYAVGIAFNGASPSLESTVIRKDLRKWIRRYCGLFISFHDSKAYLIHQTAKEFLICSENIQLHTWKGSFSVKDVEQLMAKICIVALNTNDFEFHDFEADDSEARHTASIGDKETVDLSSFLAYCAEFWVDHLQKPYESLVMSMRRDIDELHDVGTKRFRQWFNVAWDAENRLRNAPNMSIVRLCSYTGHQARLEEELDQRRNDINAQDREGRGALYWSAWRGYRAISQLLLDKGADINAQGGPYGNSLQAASAKGHAAVVKLLLDKGADINAQGGLYGNALQAASAEGHAVVIQLLLDKGAYINAEGGDCGNVLQAASIRGDEAVVQLLLDKGADVNAQGGPYGNALQAASAEGHAAVVKLLLDKGADINAQGGYYGNILQAASIRGYEAIVKLLLDEGADINAQGGYFVNALKAASVAGHEAVVQLLLDKGLGRDSKYLKEEEDDLMSIRTDNEDLDLDVGIKKSLSQAFAEDIFESLESNLNFRY